MSGERCPRCGHKTHDNRMMCNYFEKDRFPDGSYGDNIGICGCMAVSKQPAKIPSPMKSARIRAMKRKHKKPTGNSGQYGNYMDYTPAADSEEFKSEMRKVLTRDMHSSLKATGLRLKRGSFKIIWGPPRWIFPEKGEPFLAATAAWKADFIK